MSCDSACARSSGSRIVERVPALQLKEKWDSSEGHLLGELPGGLGSSISGFHHLPFFLRLTIGSFSTMRSAILSGTKDGKACANQTRCGLFRLLEKVWMLRRSVVQPRPGCGCSAVMQAERRQAVGRAGLDACMRLSSRRITEFGGCGTPDGETWSASDGRLCSITRYMTVYVECR